MKRRTTRKKQEDIQKKKKGYFTDMIVGIILVVLFTILTLGSLHMYNEKTLTYEDVEQKEFTFKNVETHGNKTISLWIYVEEEELPLIVQSTVVHWELRSKLNKMDKGDTVSCYVKPNSGKFSYTIVELKTDEMIFSLDYYNEQNKQNGLIGLIAMPIFAVASLVFTLIFAIKYKKLKNANP